MKKFLNIFVLVLAIIATFAFVSCDDDPVTPPTPDPEMYTVSVVEGTGGGVFEEGTSVTVNANPKSNEYVFDGWFDGETQVGTAVAYTFTVSKDVTLTAKYSYAPYRLLSENEKDDYVNDLDLKWSNRFDEESGNYWDGWSTTVTRVSSPVSPVGQSETAMQVSIAPQKNEQGEEITTGALQYGGVWSTVDFGMLGKTVKVYDYQYLEFDFKFDNAQNWFNFSFLTADGKQTKEYGYDIADSYKTKVLISKDGWCHMTIDLSELFDFATLQNEEAELTADQKQNEAVLGAAKYIRFCVSSSKADQTKASVVYFDNIHLTNTPFDASELDTAVRAELAAEEKEANDLFNGFVVEENRNDLSFTQSKDAAKDANSTYGYILKAGAELTSWPSVLVRIGGSIDFTDSNKEVTVQAKCISGYKWVSFKYYNADWEQVGDQQGFDLTEGWNTLTLSNTGSDIQFVRITVNCENSETDVEFYFDNLNCLEKKDNDLLIGSKYEWSRTPDNVSYVADASAAKDANSSTGWKYTCTKESGWPICQIKLAKAYDFSDTSKIVTLDVMCVSGYSWIEFKFHDANWADIGAKKGYDLQPGWNTITLECNFSSVYLFTVCTNADDSEGDQVFYFDNLQYIDKPDPRANAVDLEGTYDFEEALAADKDWNISFDLKFTSAADTHINICLGNSGWNDYIGYFELNNKDTIAEDFDGVTITKLEDGWFNVTINTAEVKKINHTIQANAGFNHEISYIYLRANWSDGSVKIDNVQISEAAAPNYTLAVTDGTGAGTFAKGTSVTVVAATDKGEDYTFVGWYVGDNQVSTESSYTFTLNANTTIVAKFNFNDKEANDLLKNSEFAWSANPAVVSFEASTDAAKDANSAKGYIFKSTATSGWPAAQINLKQVCDFSDSKKALTMDIKCVSGYKWVGIKWYDSSWAQVGSEKGYDLEEGWNTITLECNIANAQLFSICCNCENATTDSVFYLDNLQFVDIVDTREDNDLLHGFDVKENNNNISFTASEDAAKDANSKEGYIFEAAADKTGYPSVLISLGKTIDFTVKNQVVTIDVKKVSGYKWFSIKYYDSAWQQVGGSTGHDCAGSDWETVTLSNSGSDIAFIRITVNCDSNGGAATIFYFDNLNVTAVDPHASASELAKNQSIAFAETLTFDKDWIISFDMKFTSSKDLTGDDLKVRIMIGNWDNYYGYFSLFNQDNIGSFDGVTITKLEDGWFHFVLDTSTASKSNMNNEAKSKDITLLYRDNRWNGASVLFCNLEYSEKAK